MPLISVHNIVSKITLSSDSGTYPVKLPNSGLYTQLEFFFQITNGATSCKDEDVYNAIDRIEVIADGNRVLYSLTGQQARLWTHVLLKRRPIYIRSEAPSVIQTAHVIVPFGRHRYDDELFLDASQYRDLELRITYSPTIAATAFATGTCVLTVHGYRWSQGQPAQRLGHLKLTEQKYFTSVASGDEPTDLPIANDYLGIGMFVYEGGIDPHVNITDVKLDINSDEFIPVQGEFEVLNSEFTAMMGINTDEWGRAFKSDTDTIETRTGSVAFVAVVPEETITTPGTTDQTLITQEALAGGQVTIQANTLDAAVTAAIAADTTDLDLDWFATAKYGLGNFLVLPFGLNNVNYALKSGDFNRVRLTLTNGNAGAEVRVSLLEVV